MPTTDAPQPMTVHALIALLSELPALAIVVLEVNTSDQDGDDECSGMVASGGVGIKCPAADEVIIWGHDDH